MDEMNEIKNKVLQKLEGNGILSQLKAQMRSKVFEIIDNQEKSDNSSPFYTNNPNAKALYQNDLGKMSLELFQNFLDNFNLDCTKKIFRSESNYQNSNTENVNLIKKNLNVNNNLFMKDVLKNVNINLKNKDIKEESNNEIKIVENKKLSNEMKFENENIKKKMKENNANFNINYNNSSDNEEMSMNTDKIINSESKAIDKTLNENDLKNYYLVEDIN